MPALLRLPDKKYAAQEKALLNEVCRSVKRFVILWDRREEVDELFRRPTAAHLAERKLGEALVKEHQVLCMKYMEYMAKMRGMTIENERGTRQGLKWGGNGAEYV